MKRILVIYGTRPEAIKLASVVRALRARRDKVELTICSTAQHGEMLNATMRAFGIRPDFDLQLMQNNQHLCDLLSRLLSALKPVLDETQPECVVVQGDTTTVMGAALAAFSHGMNVAHVEAGLRTGDKRP